PAELFHHELDILPYEPFVRGVAQQVRGMKRRHHPDAPQFVPVSAKLADGSLDLEERLNRKRAEPDNDARADKLDLTEQERFARRDFVRLGISIARRTAFDHVADINLGPRHAHPALDDIGKQLPRAPD